ncbi:uroporphyrinogen-III synthase [Brevibacillus thermoruber]|uniref:uroporphyrinogen-III synthase n=1 Tax=Brevibacillus thermoruber TaxID=33942 RepID=UPI000415DF1E|nr:uroporphyrinogen-III synthase [Brevibacillus thermoruber]
MNRPAPLGEDRLPLSGVRVMVTRARSQARELVEKIEALGGEAYVFPLLKMVPPADTGPLDDAIARLDAFDWVMFTSVNGVRFFLDRMRQLGVSPDRMTARVAAVGPKTAAELDKHGWTADVIPSDYVAEGMLAALRGRLAPGQRVLLPRADIARKTLPDELRRMGLQVTEVDAYETVIDGEGAPEAAERLRRGEIDAIAFTSSSTVQHFMQVMAPYGLDGLLVSVRIVCIGPVTAETAKRLGLPVHAVAREYTVDGLLQALTANLGGDVHGTHI